MAKTAPKVPPKKAPAKPKAEKPAKAPKPPKVEQNGLSRPTKGVTARIWEICDGLVKSLKRNPTREEVLNPALAEGINFATSSTQYARWRQFNGIKGQVADPARAEEKKALEELKAKKRAEREAAKAAKEAEKAAAAKARADAKAATPKAVPKAPAKKVPAKK